MVHTRVAPRRLLAVGQSISVAGVALLAAGVGVESFPLVAVGLLLAVASVGLIMLTAMALGMAAAGGRAGSASGVFGIVQFAVGAVASPLAGTRGSPWLLVIVLGVCAVAGPVLLHLIHGSVVLGPSPEGET